MELFFEEVLMKKNEQIGLICSYIWYNTKSAMPVIFYVFFGIKISILEKHIIKIGP